MVPGLVESRAPGSFRSGKWQVASDTGMKWTPWVRYLTHHSSSAVRGYSAPKKTLVKVTIGEFSRKSSTVARVSFRSCDRSS